jgi:rRNA biogenesis protein RRP5
MLEGIVTNYPKRMDVWAIYMDMEVKYGGKDNATQARNLFERCLSLPEIKRKPRSMKLVFRKYMEFESQHGNKSNLTKLR